nr:uncharacterized protein LOC109780987 [Aegilops tauschii subsp. strangulata]
MRKRKQGAALFGSEPKKAKNPSAATRRKEAAAKAAKFQKLPKAPPMEAARLEKAEADKAEAAALKKLAEAEADAAAKKRLEEAVRRQEPLFVVPLNSALPLPEFVAPTGGAGDEHPIMEREGGDIVMPDVVVPPAPPSGGARDKQLADPPVPPAEREMVTGLTPEVRTPSRRLFAKAASAPHPLEVSVTSSSIPDAEATSAAPADWDYHNLRAVAFNSNIRELDRRAADLSESRKANATLQQQLGEANTALRAKEADCSKLAEERDRLTTQLAEQAELLKKAQKEAEEKEVGLLAEFETERSASTDKGALLTAGFGKIRDMVDDFLPGHSAAANQAIEADRVERRAEGAQIAANAPRTLSEQLLSIQEAHEELVAVERDLVKRAAAIAEYTNTSIFVPELAENGAEAPPEWFGPNPEDGEDSAEVIDSSDEGEDEEDEEGEEEAPEADARGEEEEGGRGGTARDQIAYGGRTPLHG